MILKGWLEGRMVRICSVGAFVFLHVIKLLLIEILQRKLSFQDNLHNLQHTNES